MPDDPLEEEGWDGDEEDEELPIIGPGESNPAPTAARSSTTKSGTAKRVGQVSGKRGNTPRAMTGPARNAAIAQATGRRHQPSDKAWRADMANGDRNKAQAKLADRSPTHHAGSGFGLA